MIAWTFSLENTVSVRYC